MRLHFLSGLPRSGTTLLASILRQNPEFQASIQTPVGRVFSEAMQAMGPAHNEAVTESFMQDEQRINVLQGIMYGYYAGEASEVIFDNNRRWTANLGAIKKCFPDAKVICCLRDPAAIVDSFERLFQAHPLNLSVIVGGQGNTTVYERIGHLMSTSGVVGFALNAFRSAFFGPYSTMLHLVAYDDLCRFPAQVLEDLHTAIGEPMFNYHWDKIVPIPGATEFDQKVNTPGLHDLKPRVVYEQRLAVIPPDIFKALPKPFWLPVKEPATPSG